MKPDIEKLRELEKQATPGKWRKGQGWFRCKINHGVDAKGKKIWHGGKKCKYTFDIWNDNFHDIRVDPGYKEGDEEVFDSQICGNYDYEEGGVVKEEDNDLICAMRNALPDLLAELETLRAIVGELATSNGTYDDNRGHDQCIFCDYKNDVHEADCLIEKAKKAIQ